MSLAVATRKARASFSAIHVSSVPRTRREVPESLPSVLSPFSISSIHSTHGAMVSACTSASRKLRSVSP